MDPISVAVLFSLVMCGYNKGFDVVYDRVEDFFEKDKDEDEDEDEDDGNA